MLIDYLGGRAREEVLCQPEEVRRDFGALGPRLSSFYKTRLQLNLRLQNMCSTRVGQKIVGYKAFLNRTPKSISYSKFRV